MKGNVNNLPMTVDGISGDSDIANLFSEKYVKLFSSVPYDNDRMLNLKHQTEKNILSCCIHGNCYNSHCITVNDINESIKQLKHGKSDGNTGFDSSHVIHASNKLSVYLCLLFNVMIKFNYIPNDILVSTIIPIPKNKQSQCNSENYRGIALGSILGKLLDLIILKQNAHVFATDDLQFGFKPNHSTTQCTFALNEIIQYYENNNSTIYVLMLDCSKAFDRVNYVKLFSILVDRGLCPSVVRILLNLYTNQSMKIKWGNSYSEKFRVFNGVKQGGVLSPILFITYMNELFKELRKSRIGCHIGDMYVGALGYADDVTLLRPTLSALKSMLQIADKFGKDYNIIFNVKKYQFLVFSSDKPVPGFYHNKVYIKSQSVANHLGHCIGPRFDKNDVKHVTDKFCVAFNSLISVFGNLSCDLKYRLFKTYCMPLYGSVLWDLSDKSVDYFFTQWRKSIRKLFTLPYTTHCNLLCHICQDFPIEYQLFSRAIKFLAKVGNSDNKVLQLCFKLAFNGSRSKVSNTLNHMSYRLKKSKTLIVQGVGNLNLLGCNPTQETVLQKASNITDLLYFRENRHKSIFTYDELTSMIELLCTE